MLMRKCQWIHMALLAFCIALPMQSWALGLGEIEVDSALNERLSGTIELIDANRFQESELFVSMASRDDFERVGVERFFYLTNIKFAVEMGADGNAYVKVTSTQPVSEPYLNFIVEILWPNGRLLKEFTVLLDPPIFSQAAAPAVSAPRQAVAPAPSRPAPTPATRGRRATQVDLSSATTSSRKPLADSLMTTRDDTLWKIASNTRASKRVSVHQQMLALQRKNPRAFIRNNINLLKAGYVLNMPTESEALSVNQGVAINDVQAQAEDWRNGATRSSERSADVAANRSGDSLQNNQAPVSRSQIDATLAQQPTNQSATESRGQVRIVASTGELATGSASGDDPSVNQLIEENTTLTRQIDELTYQLDREKDIAVNQISVKDRQLEVKDQELAQVQQRMKELQEQLAQQAAQSQNQSPNPSPEATPWWMSPLVLFGVIGALILILVFALFSLRKSRAAETSYFAAEEEEFLDVDDARESAVEDPSDDDQIDSEEPVEPFIGDLQTDAASDDTGDHEVLTLSEDDDEDLAERDAAASDSADDAAPEDDSGRIQTGDVIGEAEIYIAYGRHGQAANLLNGALESEPERWDIRLKLLEVYVESHDEANFEINAQYILDHCDDDDILLACRELEGQLEHSQIDLSEDSDASPAEDVALEIESESASGDFALELEEIEEDEEIEEIPEIEKLVEVEPAAEADDTLDAISLDEVPASNDDVTQIRGSTTDGTEDEHAESDEIKSEDNDSTDKGIDFELEFDTDEEAPAAADEPAPDSQGAGDQLGGDLGLDFDPEKDVEEATETADSDSDDFDFDTDGDTDINATKLDLAEAYVDMGDADGAQDILNEVLEEGNAEQKQKAQEMLDSLADSL